MREHFLRTESAIKPLFFNFLAQVPDDEQFVPDFQSDNCKYCLRLLFSGVEALRCLCKTSRLLWGRFLGEWLLPNLKPRSSLPLGRKHVCVCAAWAHEDKAHSSLRLITGKTTANRMEISLTDLWAPLRLAACS